LPVCELTCAFSRTHANALTRVHARTLTRTLTRTLSHSHSLSLSLSLTHSHSLSSTHRTATIPPTLHPLTMHPPLHLPDLSTFFYGVFNILLHPSTLQPLLHSCVQSCLHLFNNPTMIPPLLASIPNLYLGTLLALSINSSFITFSTITNPIKPSQLRIAYNSLSTQYHSFVNSVSLPYLYRNTHFSTILAIMRPSPLTYGLWGFRVKQSREILRTPDGSDLVLDWFEWQGALTPFSFVRRAWQYVVFEPRQTIFSTRDR